MNRFNPVCTCGHDLASHEKITNAYGGGRITICRADDGDTMSETRCSCSGFAVDSGHEQTVGQAEGRADGNTAAEGAPPEDGAADRDGSEETSLSEALLPPERDFGARVRESRRAKGWTLETTVRALMDAGADISDRVLSAIERGDREPRLSEAFALRDVLDVDMEPVDDDRFYVTMSVMEPGGTTYTASVLVGDGDVSKALYATYESAANRYSWR